MTDRMTHTLVGIRLLHDVRGDWPIGYNTIAPAGEYIAESNAHGALSVLAADGTVLGVKPGEFELVEEAQ